MFERLLASFHLPRSVHQRKPHFLVILVISRKVVLHFFYLFLLLLLLHVVPVVLRSILHLFISVRVFKSWCSTQSSVHTLTNSPSSGVSAERRPSRPNPMLDGKKRSYSLHCSDCRRMKSDLMASLISFFSISPLSVSSFDYVCNSFCVMML